MFIIKMILDFIQIIRLKNLKLSENNIERLKQLLLLKFKLQNNKFRNYNNKIIKTTLEYNGKLYLVNLTIYKNKIMGDIISNDILIPFDCNIKLLNRIDEVLECVIKN